MLRPVRRHGALDAAFLAAVTAVSTLPSVWRLGFYHDDHHFLGLLATAPDQSLGGLLDAFRDGEPKQNLRPAQQVLFSGLYRLFGLDPAPWHAVNAVLVVAMVVLLFALLRELRLPRLVTIAVPLLYGLLPHWASARFWPATFAEPLSMLLLFASLLLALRALSARPAVAAPLVVLAGAALAVSMLAYEVAMPLFLTVPALVALAWRGRPGPGRRRLAAVGVPFGAALLVTTAWKVQEARVVGQVTDYDLGYPHGFAYHLAYLGQGILRVNVGTYGLGLPYVVGWILVNRLSLALLAAALLVGLATYLYLRFADRDGATLPDSRLAARLVGAGVLLVVLGYAIFVTNAEILFRSAGIDNRVAIAAGVGVALCAVGGSAWVARRVAGARAPVVFRSLVAALAASGFLIVGTLAGYWADAWSRQRAILGELRDALPADPRGSTVLLDGACPELGPAVVYVSTTDLAGALKAAYRDDSLAAAVVRDRLELRGDGAHVTNTFLGEVSSVLFYPYAPGLAVYNAELGRLFPLTSAAEGRRYSALAPPRPRCPPLRSFAWGIDIERWRIFA